MPTPHEHSAEFPAELLAELNSIAQPTPNSQYVHIEDSMLNLTLPIEFRKFLSRSAVSLRLVIKDAPPVTVYADPDLSATRLGDLVEHDSRLRSDIDQDLEIFESFLTNRTAASGDLPTLLRATNRLRAAFVPLEGDIALAGKTICSILLNDLLEVSAFL
jgi:hypothetical protein